MEQLTHLPDKTQTQLLRTIESMPHIRHRGDFFLWSQGHLQGVLPHSALIGVLLDEEGSPLYIEGFHGAPGIEDELAQLTSQPNGAAVKAAQAYLRAASTTEVAGDTEEAVHALIAGTSLGAPVCCGTGALPGSGGSFFALLGLSKEVSAADRLLLKALLPQLHLALSRAYGFESSRAMGRSESVEGFDMTERQLEILHWIKLGKTNFEIAQILDISALTVKNHLQKIFKKLDVHNRAQAVAKYMALPQVGKSKAP